MAGFERVRSAIVPVPSSSISGNTRDSARNSSSGTCVPGQANPWSPPIATSPLPSWSDASMRLSAMIASGSGPPNAPLCCAIGSTSTRTVTCVAPRMLVPIVGTPVR